MFPIPWNFPFRKKNGDVTTLDAVISGGSSYTLPTASEDTKGGVKIGAGLEMVGETLNNTNPTPATPYELPTASDETLGGIKVGSGLSINENGVLSASGGGGGMIYSKIENPTSYNNSAITLTDDALVTFHALQTSATFSINGTTIYTTFSETKQDVVFLLKKGDVVDVVSQCKFLVTYLGRS